MQNITNYEIYRLTTEDGTSVTFWPDASIKIGPFFGWRWIFGGYTVDVRHMDLKHKNRTRTEYDVSLYSSKIGVDLFYRKTGNDYKIRRMTMSGEHDYDLSLMKDAPFNGLTSSIKGFNVYYIFNHRRFSYPAAFSQSTVQRRSAGSPLLGLGLTRHTLSVDWEKLDTLVSQRLNIDRSEIPVDSALLFGDIRYTDLSLTAGYAYNWVFARNWLLAGSLSVGVSYKHTSGESRHKHFKLHDFTFDNINLDGVGRFALVYNNSRWYAGASAVMHAYNYRKSRFYTNNVFGSVNVYIGYNFGRRKN